jgi:hypothetical protein
MITRQDKINNSVQALIFTLYKEGLFYRCYNEDAMLFVKKVKEYKVTSRFIKTLNNYLYCLGFPESEVSKGKMPFQQICDKLNAQKFEIIGETVVFTLCDLEAKQGFSIWKKGWEENRHAAVSEMTYKDTKESTGYNMLLEMIRNFDLANSTPMQSMHFIQTLKEHLIKIANHGIV